VAWEKMSEQTKKLKGEEIRLLCAADRVPGRVEELNVMRHLLIKLVSETKYFPAMSNRILLEVIDYGDNLPTDRNIETLPKEKWIDSVNAVATHRKEFFHHDRYTDLLLPVRLQGNWILVICVPEIRGIHTVVFNEWVWDQDEIHKLLDKIARLIRDVAFQTRLNLPGIFQEELTK